MKNKKILIADDHPMLLRGLLMEFEDCGYTSIITASNGLEAFQKLIKHKPELCFLDVEMPYLDGFEVIKKAKSELKDTKYAILTYHKEKSFYIKAKLLEINGYLLKDDPFTEIESAIKSMLENKFFLSSTLNKSFIEDAKKQYNYLKFLSQSEQNILLLLAQELNSKQIAEKLQISVRTVQKHRSNIIAKLELDLESDNLMLWAKRHQYMLHLYYEV